MQTKEAKGGIHGSHSRKFLLVIDNAEMVIEKCPNEFKNLVNTLLTSCEVLQIVVTSRQWIIMDDIVSQTFEVLHELNPEVSVELFMRVADDQNQIKNEEIYQLLK